MHIKRTQPRVLSGSEGKIRQWEDPLLSSHSTAWLQIRCKTATNCISRTCTHLVSIQLQIQTSPGQTELARGPGDIAAMLAQRFRNHLALNFG